MNSLEEKIKTLREKKCFVMYPVPFREIEKSVNLDGAREIDESNN